MRKANFALSHPGSITLGLAERVYRCVNVESEGSKFGCLADLLALLKYGKETRDVS
jgi:hypothetical protein